MCFLVDRNGNLFRKVCVHQAGSAWSLCPARLQAAHPTEHYPPCEICALAQTQADPWQLEARDYFLTYGLLLESTHRDPYWHPGLYVLIGTDRMHNALIQMIESLADQDPELVVAMLNPCVAGCATRVTVQRGRQGAVDVTPIREQVVPPIKGGALRPLEKCWISPVFSPPAYQKVLVALRERSR